MVRGVCECSGWSVLKGLTVKRFVLVATGSIAMFITGNLPSQPGNCHLSPTSLSRLV